MRKYFFLVPFIIICIYGNLVAASTNISEVPKVPDATVKLDPLTFIDHLIEVTEKNLESQKQLRGMVKEYMQIQVAYLKSPSDKELALKMVKSAHEVLAKIKETNLTQAFDPDFISELNLFSQIASKRGIPSP